jgi:C-terminal processing protease CtpA/Prc
MPEVVLIKRQFNNMPFGFKLQGGIEFSVPLSILEVTPNSIADKAGLRPGDAITKINNTETAWMEHNRAKQEIVNCGDMYWLTIERY